MNATESDICLVKIWLHQAARLADCIEKFYYTLSGTKHNFQKGVLMVTVMSRAEFLKFSYYDIKYFISLWVM